LPAGCKKEFSHTGDTPDCPKTTWEFPDWKKASVHFDFGGADPKIPERSPHAADSAWPKHTPAGKFSAALEEASSPPAAPPQAPIYKITASL
jgi:hypothetical protein